MAHCKMVREVAGKFSQSLRLEGNGYVSADAEPLSLSSNLTISIVGENIG